MTRARSRCCRWTLLLMLAMLPEVQAAPATDALVALGRRLFHDTALSGDGTVSCASCHAPQRAWTDARRDVLDGAVSAGVSGRSGSRNAPTLAYVALVPPLQQQPDGSYSGGLFWDGRSNTLAAQVAGPLFHPDEMGLAAAPQLLQRLQENAAYAQEFSHVFGAASLADATRALAAVGEALAAYQGSSEFLAFDSRYDRYLRGEYEPTAQEALGMALFFSPQFTNCSQCHQLQRVPQTAGESFSNQRYENIGVPVNTALRAANGLGDAHVDNGLLEHPEIDDPAQAGRFKVPTLRNVALTAPYMHNGVFADLRTVLLFYNKYLARGSKAQINPETGQAWGEPEVAQNLALEKLEVGRALDERSIDALLAFLRMLTDQRYEPLLEFAQQ